MAGPTIDHMVSVIILVAALLLSFTVYNQILANAIAYERHRQVAMKAMDLMDTICLSPGDPPYWGQSHSTPSAFGLQDPESRGYTLSPFSTMRLLSSEGTLIYYPKTGMWFSNISMGQGGFFGVPADDCVNYTTVAELLGANESYGFQLTIEPTVRVSVSEVTPNPLELNVEVRGPGLALSGATLHYYLYRVYKPDDSDYPWIESRSGITETDSTGSAILEFDPPIDGSQSAYSIIVYAHLSGLVGVGYYSHGTIENNHIIPFIENFEQGEILLVHSWDVHEFPNPYALHYNATFFLLTQNFELRQIQIEGETSGLLNYGDSPHTYARLQIPTSEAGILFVAYRKSATEIGAVIMPWGISTPGASVTFGDEPSDREWVATELRQVTFNGMSYQVKLAAWSLED